VPVAEIEGLASRASTPGLSAPTAPFDSRRIDDVTDCVGHELRLIGILVVAALSLLDVLGIEVGWMEPTGSDR
jgi:hypothetical protein